MTVTEAEADHLMAIWARADAAADAAHEVGDAGALRVAVNVATAAQDLLEAIYPHGPPEWLRLKYIEAAGRA